jgi:predicted heme/steroid binding protein
VDIISDCIELNGRRLGFKTAHQMFKWFDERFHVVDGVRDHLGEDELGIARAEAAAGAVETKKQEEEEKPAVSHEGLKAMSREELGRFDGKEGRQIYVAYKGLVYDLTTSPLFQGEQRMRCHLAGKDLTRMMSAAPHGEDLLFRFPRVGTLTE